MDLQSTELLLETAIKIGRRICKQAIWQDNKCTWEITTPDKVNPKLRIGKKEIAGGTVYQGTAGIAIFLFELFRLTNQQLFEKTGRGAIEYALDEAHNLQPNSFGFHSGLVGITYSSILCASYSDDDTLQKKGLQLLEPLKGQENNDHVLDVIGGAGGAIPALLKIYELTKNQISLELAINLGESLISKANMEPHGWSWGISKTSSIRGLCGYAHGASGICHAFLELYNLTSSDYYIYAAEQAFLYERQFYNDREKNWPDFRYTELSEYTAYNKIQELKEALKNKTLPPYQTHYMSAWCHGAPGIGLARLRAYQLTGNETYASESRNAISATIKSLYIPHGNYSLCHGFLGNAETLLNASRIFNDSELSLIVENKVMEGIELFEKKNLFWPCGTMGSVTDPSLMLGEAGIGHFILRAYDESVPSVLCITSNAKHGVDKNYRTLQKEYINQYFLSTLSLIDKTEKKESYLISKIAIEPGEIISDIKKILAIIEQYILGVNNSLGEIIREHFNMEKKKYSLTLAITDYTKEYLKGFARESNGHFDWLQNKFCLADGCKVLKSKYKFDHINIDANYNDVLKKKSFLLMFRQENQIKIKEISLFTYSIFNTLKEPTLLADIFSSLQDTFEIEPKVFNQLQEKTKAQLIDAYKAGVINIS